MTAKPTQPPTVLQFVFGGLSGMGATLIVQPFDLLKNRMQLLGKQGISASFPGTVKAVVRNEGFFALYNGLSAGLLRQAVYTTTRLGVYNSLFERSKGPDGKPPGFAMKTIIGMSAGAFAATVGNPTELALVRMSADGAAPAAERRGYTNVFNAIARIAREEGVATLWRGCAPTVVRAMVVNAVQLATYSQFKEAILRAGWQEEGIGLHFSASMLSGLATTIASMPVDIIKTRLQNMKVINGVPEYTGMADIVGRIVRQEGVLALWRGFIPYYSRLGPHTVLTFIFMEQLKTLYLSTL